MTGRRLRLLTVAIWVGMIVTTRLCGAISIGDMIIAMLLVSILANQGEKE